jgi:tRNA G18 (ribose-2'-O)-methylase SpoU
VIRVVESDSRLRDYRRIAHHGALRAAHLFVAEGRAVVQRALESGRPVRSLLLSETARQALQPAMDHLDPRVPVYVCDLAAFEAITGFPLHRGCLAIVERPPVVDPADLVMAATTLVVLDAVSDPDNVGGIFRNVAAFGADGVLLGPGCADPLYRKAVRTSMAATLAVPFAHVPDLAEGLAMVRSRGRILVALTPHETATDLDAFDRVRLPGPLALLVGAEGPGLSAEALACADARVRIPIRPEIDSLNVAVATGIALSRLTAR